MPGADGIVKLRRLRKEWPQAKVIVISGGDKTGRMNLRQDARCGPSRGWIGSRSRAARSTPSRIPSVKPAFDSFLLDDAGYLWVDPVTPKQGEGRVFDVFDPDGRYLGQARANVRLSGRPVFRGDYVYATTEDESGIPYVIRARIIRGSNWPSAPWAQAGLSQFHWRPSCAPGRSPGGRNSLSCWRGAGRNRTDESRFCSSPGAPANYSISLRSASPGRPPLRWCFVFLHAVDARCAPLVPRGLTWIRSSWHNRPRRHPRATAGTRSVRKAPSPNATGGRGS
jgi:hypothetical protein